MVAFETHFSDFINTSEVTLKLDLDDGLYLIVPCTDTENINLEFMLQVFSEEKINLRYKLLILNIFKWFWDNGFCTDYLSLSHMIFFRKYKSILLLYIFLIIQIDVFTHFIAFETKTCLN